VMSDPRFGMLMAFVLVAGMIDWKRTPQLEPQSDMTKNLGWSSSRA
jgi:hypothetical protein